MRRDTKRYGMLVIGIITGFIFIASFFALYVSDHIKNSSACGCAIPASWMIIILSSLGFFVGGLVYFILSEKYTKEKEELIFDARAALNFLEREQRIIVEALLAHRCGMFQSEITNATGIHKVKVHRLIKKMVDKGLVSVQIKGKRRLIKLAGELCKLTGSISTGKSRQESD